MDTELSVSSIFNDPTLLMFMQTLEQVSQQQQQQPLANTAQPQQHALQQQQLQSQQANQTSNATLEQILQQVSILQAFQDLAAQQNGGAGLDSMMIQEDEQEDDAASDQNTVQQHQQHQAINQFVSQKLSPALTAQQPFNSQYNNSQQRSQDDLKSLQNSLLTLGGELKYDNLNGMQTNGIKSALLSSPSLTSVNLSHNQENNLQQQQQSQKGRAKKDTSSSTIRIKQASASSQLIEAPTTPSQFPIIPEIIIPTASSSTKTNTSTTTTNLSNINSNTTSNNNNNNNNNHQSNNFNLDLDSFNLGSILNNNGNSNVSDEMQLMNLLSSYLSIEQLVQLALTGGNNQNSDNAQAAAAAAALALMMSNNGNNSNNNSNLDSLNNNNDSGEDNGQNQMYAKYQHLMNTPTSSNLFNSNNKTAINTSNGTTKTQQSKILSGASSANHQNSNANIFHNITTNLSSFFDMSGFNSGEKKALSPTSSRQTSSFIPHIIQGNNNGQQQQQLPAQQLNFSQMGSMLNSIDPTSLSFQALIAQHGGIDTPDVMRLREQKRLERQLKIERYKNKRRNWIRKISYDCRKRVADSRLRIKGRFISKKDSEKLKHKGDDSSCQQENMMALEHNSHIDSNKQQDSNDNHHQKQYFEEVNALQLQEQALQFQNQQQNPEMMETDEPNQVNLKGFEIQNAASQSNLENNNLNPTEETNNQNSCELTCAAAMNPSNISNLMKPDVMEKVKQRISDKKPLFSLINPESTPQRLFMEIQNQSTSSTSTSSTSSASNPSKAGTTEKTNSSTKMNIDQHKPFQQEQQLIEA